MASSILDNVLPKFPVGTLVKVYGTVVSDGGPPRPLGVVYAEAVVDAVGRLTFEGLDRQTPGRTLYAAALVESRWQVEQFTGPQGGVVVSEELAEFEEEIAEKISGSNEPVAT